MSYDKSKQTWGIKRNVVRKRESVGTSVENATLVIPMNPRWPNLITTTLVAGIAWPAPRGASGRQGRNQGRVQPH